MPVWLRKASVILVFFLAVLIIFLFVFKLGEDLSFNSPLLLLILNTLFLTGTGISVAVISARSFLKEGSGAILVLGLATATAGLSALIAGSVASLSVDYNIATYNLGIFASGGLQFLSAILVSIEVVPRPLSNRKRGLILGYLSVAVFLTIISTFIVLGYAPTFFTASGPTIIRQWVIASAILFFIMSTAVFGWHYRSSKSPILYWYTLALALSSIGLLGAALVTILNTVFNWIVRLATYLAGFYFLAGLLTKNNAKDKSKGNEGLSARFADAFINDRRQLDALFGKMLNSFAYHKIICDDNGKPVDYVFLDVNDRFEQMTGLKKERILGRRATSVIPGIDKDPADWIGVYGRVALSLQPVQFERYAEQLNK
jgi:PAS domain-containing protein